MPHRHLPQHHVGRVGVLAFLLGVGVGTAGITFAGCACADTPPPARPASAGQRTPAGKPAAAVKASAPKPAPATATTSPAVAATTVFPNAAWLNTPIPADPTPATNNAVWVKELAAGKHVANLNQYGVTIPQTDTQTPRYAVKLAKTGAWGKNPFAGNTIPIPKGTVPPPGTDGQIAVYDPTTGNVYSIWQAKYNKKTDMWSGTWGGVTPANGDGVDTAGAGTGSGISRMAGIIGTQEFAAAANNNTGLDHALVFSTNLAGPQFVGPATKSDGLNIAGVSAPIPEGTRIQLDPTINVDAIPGITPGEKVIAKTLQTYGAYVVDQGGATAGFVFQTAPDATTTQPGAVYTTSGLAWDYYDLICLLFLLRLVGTTMSEPKEQWRFVGRKKRLFDGVGLTYLVWERTDGVPHKCAMLVPPVRHVDE